MWKQFAGTTLNFIDAPNIATVPSGGVSVAIASGCRGQTAASTWTTSGTNWAEITDVGTTTISPNKSTTAATNVVDTGTVTGPTFTANGTQSARSAASFYLQAISIGSPLMMSL